MLNLKAVTQFKKDFKKYRYNEPVLEETGNLHKTLKSSKLCNAIPCKYSAHKLLFTYIVQRKYHDRRPICWQKRGASSPLFAP